MACLKHSVNGNLVGMILLEGAATIGRSTENTIVLDDPTVSLRHAKVEQRDGQWWVSDSDSTNGVHIAGKRIPEHALEEGLVFTLGTHSFEYSTSPADSLDKTLKIKKSWIPGVYYTE